MKRYVGMEVSIHVRVLLTSALVEVSGQLQAPTALVPWEEAPVLIGYDARWARKLVGTLWRREKSFPYLEPNPGFTPVHHVYIHILVHFSS
jgi:hypothetical protein